MDERGIVFEQSVIVLDPEINELQVGVLAKPPLFLPCFINMIEGGVYLDCFSLFPNNSGENDLKIKLAERYDNILEAMTIVCRLLADAAFVSKRFPPDIISLNGKKSEVPVWSVILEGINKISLKVTFPYLAPVKKQIPQFKEYTESQYMKKAGAFSRAIVH
jgi:hypothetical protein